jgi:hypothetical protein
MFARALNRDGTVDIYDAIFLASLFNVTFSNPRWNPNGDINSDGIIDISDAITLEGSFGWQFQSY